MYESIIYIILKIRAIRKQNRVTTRSPLRRQQMIHILLPPPPPPPPPLLLLLPPHLRLNHAGVLIGENQINSFRIEWLEGGKEIFGSRLRQKHHGMCARVCT